MVFEAGLAASRSSWAAVQPAVACRPARRGRLCARDRLRPLGPGPQRPTPPGARWRAWPRISATCSSTSVWARTCSSVTAPAGADRPARRVPTPGPVRRPHARGSHRRGRRRAVHAALPAHGASRDPRRLAASASAAAAPALSEDARGRSTGRSPGSASRGVHPTGDDSAKRRERSPGRASAATRRPTAVAPPIRRRAGGRGWLRARSAYVGRCGSMTDALRAPSRSTVMWPLSSCEPPARSRASCRVGLSRPAPLGRLARRIPGGELAAGPGPGLRDAVEPDMETPRPRLQP